MQGDSQIVLQTNITFSCLVERHALRVECVMFRNSCGQVSVMFSIQTESGFMSYCVTIVLPLYAVMHLAEYLRLTNRL